MRPPFASVRQSAGFPRRRVQVQLTSLVLCRGLVNNSAVLKTSKIKHANATVLPAADEHVDALGAESHVVNLFVVGDQLRLCRQRGNVPDGAGSVYARSDDQAWRDRVPVKRRQRSRVVRRLGVREQGKRRELGNAHVPAVSGCYRCARSGHLGVGWQRPQPEVIA